MEEQVRNIILLDEYFRRAKINPEKVNALDTVVMENGFTIDITKHGYFDPEVTDEIAKTFVQYHDQRFLFKEQTILAGELSFESSDELYEHVRELINELDLREDSDKTFQLMGTPHGNLLYVLSERNTVDYLKLSDLKIIQSEEEFLNSKCVVFMHIVNYGNEADLQKNKYNISDFNYVDRIVGHRGNIFGVYTIKGTPEEVDAFMKEHYNMGNQNGVFMFNYDEQNNPTATKAYALDTSEYIEKTFLKDFSILLPRSNKLPTKTINVIRNR